MATNARSPRQPATRSRPPPLAQRPALVGRVHGPSARAGRRSASGCRSAPPTWPRRGGAATRCSARLPARRECELSLRLQPGARGGACAAPAAAVRRLRPESSMTPVVPPKQSERASGLPLVRSRTRPHLRVGHRGPSRQGLRHHRRLDPRRLPRRSTRAAAWPARCWPSRAWWCWPARSRSVASLDHVTIVREAIARDRLHRSRRAPFNADSVNVLQHITGQAWEIGRGVDPGDQQVRRAGRGRPGHHVRLRHRRDAGADAAARSCSRTGWRAAWPTTAASGRCPGCGPTARRRSRWSTRTAGRGASPTCSSRRSTRATRRARRIRAYVERRAGPARARRAGPTTARACW